MSSLVTNAGAMTALQNLKATNKALDVTQGRISTGFRISEASHNAAYWSIATTMRSDNSAMSTVQDALGLGAAQVDVAYTAMESVKDTLNEIKNKLVAASQPNIDKSKIQEEIVQLQNDLQTFAKSATFSGGNWLDVDQTGIQQVVASFIREGNDVSLETIDVNTANVALFTGSSSGILQEGFSVEQDKDITGVANPAGTPGSDTGPTGGTATITGIATADLWNEGDTFSFSVAVNGGDAVTVTMTYGTAAWTAQDVNDALDAAGVTGVTATYAAANDGTITLTTDATGAGNAVVIDDLAATETVTDADTTVTNFDISEASREQIQLHLSDVESALNAVTTAASDLGAIKSRISSQSDFVGKLMDAVNRGIGQLVDADMTEESSRLQALQVQQQLGIQALSIANGNSQMILGLFR